MARNGVKTTLFPTQTLQAPTPDPIPQPVDQSLARTATWAIRSPTLPIPNNLNSFYLELTTDPGGFTDPAEWVMVIVETSWDNGASWIEDHWTLCGGTRSARDGGMPSLTFSNLPPRIGNQQRLARAALLSLAGTPRVGVVGDAI
jgi:hypothetical protein